MAYGQPYNRGINKAQAPNPYGNKTGPRRRSLGLADVAGLAGPFLPGGIGGSPAYAALQNTLGGFQSEADWQRFEGQVDANNRFGDRANTMAGYGAPGSSPIAYSDQINRETSRFADNAFGDTAIQYDLNNSFDRVKGGLAHLPGTIAGQTSGYLGDYGNSTGGITQQFNQGASGINARYDERLNNARGIVSKFSGQETADANRSFDERAAAQRSNLSSLGFSGGVQSSLAGGIERDRRAEMNRLSDIRAQRELGVEQGFAGEALQAQAGLLGASTNLQSGFANNALTGGMNAASLNSSTGLNAYAQRGQIGQAELDAKLLARQQRLNTRLEGANSGLRAREGVLSAGNNWYGPNRTLMQPQGYNPIIPQPQLKNHNMKRR